MYRFVEVYTRIAYCDVLQITMYQYYLSHDVNTVQTVLSAPYLRRWSIGVYLTWRKQLMVAGGVNQMAPCHGGLGYGWKPSVGLVSWSLCVRSHCWLSCWSQSRKIIHVLCVTLVDTVRTTVLSPWERSTVCLLRVWVGCTGLEWSCSNNSGLAWECFSWNEPASVGLPWVALLCFTHRCKRMQQHE